MKANYKINHVDKFYSKSNYLAVYNYHYSNTIEFLDWTFRTSITAKEVVGIWKIKQLKNK